MSADGARELQVFEIQSFKIPRREKQLTQRNGDYPENQKERRYLIRKIKW